MKKLILTFGIFLAGIFFVNAQDNTSTDNRPSNLVTHLTQICGLTSDQVSKVQPLAVDFFKTRDANKQQYANDPAGLKKANMQARKSYKAKLDAILTPDQQEKLNEAKEKRKAEMMKKGGASADPDGDDQK